MEIGAKIELEGTKAKQSRTGQIFNIQRCSTQDGPGIRATVFLKGCPLRCLWCSNPESQNSYPELAFTKRVCTQCGKCQEVCAQEAITIISGEVHIDRSKCTCCGECVRICIPGALKIFGTEMSVDEVLAEVSRDQLFYRSSGGGVTVSGGEPLFQPDFLVDLLRGCNQLGFHTTVDTSGYSSPETVKRILPHVDLVLYDIKHMDTSIHEKFTQGSNEPILRNAELIASQGVAMIVRIPLILGFNDTVENIEKTAIFTSSLGNCNQIDLLPYHRWGEGKYEMLGRTFNLTGLQPISTEEIEHSKSLIESYGLRCEIGG